MSWMNIYDMEDTAVAESAVTLCECQVLLVQSLQQPQPA